MQRMSELAARIKSLGELGEVVGAMRALSAVRVQQAHDLLLALRQYSLVIEDALADAVAGGAPASEGAPDPVPTVVVAFCSEHGFVGSFNERVLVRAVEHLGGRLDRLLVVGSRGVVTANERRYPIAWTCPMASHVGGAGETAFRIAEEIARRTAGELARVVLVYTRSSGGATWRIVVETLLPFDLGRQVARQRGAVPPITHLEPRVLIEKLVEELVFAELTRATMESLASENSARLQTMQSARDNIERKLADLQSLEREGRQEEITTELLDIVTGAVAMSGPDGF
ncbi:MAG TPA: FoF1 ATP synthase subunit gamma [Polyangiaceae bacterium]|nr:FoF1 ATP synthase subunit gamma [Polyangiaceae bacterium]